jgi:DNA-directed RNA polymerase specialized sigma24 family protein
VGLANDLREGRPVREAPFMVKLETGNAIDAKRHPEQCGDQAAPAIDLYWLAFLLTGDREASIDIAADVEVSDPVGSPFFTGWMRAWSRRLVIAKALAAVREELAVSRCGLDAIRVSQPVGSDLKRPPHLTKAAIEVALLAIGLFPRAALLLSLFEGIALEDVATLLDADVALVKKARTAGLQELTANLASVASRTFPDFSATPAFAPAAN